jgi:hypothetical protein
MKKLYKDILRYIILTLITWQVFVVADDIFIYATTTKEISTATTTLILASHGAIIAGWIYVFKKFFETSAT